MNIQPKINIINKYLKREILYYLDIETQINCALLSKHFQEMLELILTISKGQFYFFYKYYQIFQNLFKLDPYSIYCNQFFDNHIFDIDRPIEMMESTFQAVIITFITNVSYNCSSYSLMFSSLKEFNFHLSIIKKFNNPRKFKYISILSSHVDYEIFKDFDTYKEILTYIDKYEGVFFQSLINKCIKMKYDMKTFSLVITSNTMLEQVQAYSVKYPNRISELYYTGNNAPFIHEIVRLNSDSITNPPITRSMIVYPSCNYLDLSINLIPISKVYCLHHENIKSIKLSYNRIYHDEIIEHLNYMHNLTSIDIKCRNSAILMKLLNELTIINLTLLSYDVYEDDDIDFAFVLNRFPNLIAIKHSYRGKSAQTKICHVYKSSNHELPIKHYEKLIKNYPDELVIYLGKTNLKEFFDYYANNKEIMGKVHSVIENCGSASKVHCHLTYAKCNKFQIGRMISFDHVGKAIMNYSEIDFVMNEVKSANPYIIEIEDCPENIDVEWMISLTNLRFIIINGILKMIKQGNMIVKLKEY